MEVRLSQPANAFSPMLFTLLGIVIEVKPQSKNASPPMLVTVYLTPPLVTVDGIFTVFVFGSPTTSTYLLLVLITLYVKPPNLNVWA